MPYFAITATIAIFATLMLSRRYFRCLRQGYYADFFRLLLLLMFRRRDTRAAAAAAFAAAAIARAAALLLPYDETRDDHTNMFSYGGMIRHTENSCIYCDAEQHNRRGDIRLTPIRR